MNSVMAEPKRSETNSLKTVLKLETDKSRNAYLTDFGKKVLNDRYLLEGEDYQDCFLRIAKAYSDDDEMAMRVYGYISKLWFMPSTPIISNGGTNRGLPISCYLNEATDSLEGIVSLWNENVWLASRGGGIGSYWGSLRSLGERISKNGETCGIVPFIKVMDSLTLAISQGSLRRGSAAVYLPVDHPEIEEFIEIRKPTGGDPNRKALNLHHGVTITDDFMIAVEQDLDWDLKSPKDGEVIRTIKARSLWIKILTTRIETGEPFVIFIDHVNKSLPKHHDILDLKVKTSNLCSEITLTTGIDHLGQERTAVCCLSSLNLEKFLEWESDKHFIKDCFRFLDNVITDFIKKAPDHMSRAKYAAYRERSVGLGTMGLHSFFQSLNIPFESAISKVWNKRIFKHIKTESDKASKELAKERGSCPDAAQVGIEERFTNKTAIAPTASISIICGESSPGIEPYAANAYTHKTLSGSVVVKNKHLMELLQSKGKNTEEVWSSILMNKGSVQHLSFLDEREKATFKTAFEINQKWIIQLAGDRAPFIDQAQSINVFLPANIDKKTLHRIHIDAWRLGVKSLYYLRSASLQRAEQRQTNNDECLACQ